MSTSPPIFYHIYPLGMCGAPHWNDPRLPVQHRLKQIHDWIPHMQDLGVTALYIGPIFESSHHGYDTLDYFQIDRRLGDHRTFKILVKALHKAGIKVYLDAVLNHVGRQFEGFRDVQRHLNKSKYKNWFHGLKFGKKRSPKGDPFTYEGWKGHYDLVKLNLQEKAVKKHLFDAVKFWIKTYDIDGLRLDAADCICPDFQSELAQYCKKIKADFWLMGEVVFGDYGEWCGPEGLDSVTNYELYDSFHKSHNKRDFRILSHTLERQFGSQGVYKDLNLYNFVDNHDVNRIASQLKHGQHLYPLHILMFSLPGVPSFYYGSEWGLEGKRTPWSDQALRPHIHHPQSVRWHHPDLYRANRKLVQLYRRSQALQSGEYAHIHSNKSLLVFTRKTDAETYLVMVNLSDTHKRLSKARLEAFKGLYLEDMLNPGQHDDLIELKGTLRIYSNWARIFRVRSTAPLKVPPSMVMAS